MASLAFVLGFVFGLGAFFAYIWWAVWRIDFDVRRVLSSGFFIVFGTSMILFPDALEWFDEPPYLLTKLERLWGSPFGATAISFGVWNYLRARDPSPYVMS